MPRSRHEMLDLGEERRGARHLGDDVVTVLVLDLVHRQVRQHVAQLVELGEAGHHRAVLADVVDERVAVPRQLLQVDDGERDGTQHRLAEVHPDGELTRVDLVLGLVVDVDGERGVRLVVRPQEVLERGDALLVALAPLVLGELVGAGAVQSDGHHVLFRVVFEDLADTSNNG